MMTFYSPKFRNRTLFANRTENDLTKNTTQRKKITVYNREKLNKYNTPKIYLEPKPFQFYSPKNFPSNFSNFNYQNEDEKMTPLIQNLANHQFFPRLTRQDIVKFLWMNGLYKNKNKRFCISCERIKEQNYGDDYSTIQQEYFPTISGRTFRDRYKKIQRHKTPSSNSQNHINDFNYRLNIPSNIDRNRYRNRNVNAYTTINQMQMQKTEERKNEGSDECDKVNDVAHKDKNEKIKIKLISPKNSKKLVYKIKSRKTFRKAQIFNLCKPFLVDEFKDFAVYK